MQELDNAKCISLTTFKRDGSPKRTPVWLTGQGGSYTFTTGKDAWKTKRIRNNPSIEAQVCNMSGKVKEGASTFTGSAEVLEDAADIAVVNAAVKKKYGIQWRLINFVDMMRTKMGKGDETIGIRLTFEQ